MIKVACKILRSKIWKERLIVYKATTTLDTSSSIKPYKEGEGYIIENHEAFDITNQNLKYNLLKHYEAL